MDTIANHSELRWEGVRIVERDYVCGYCNRHTSSIQGLPLNGYDTQDGKNGIYICTHCKLPSFFWDNLQVPGNKFGSEVNGISNELAQLYEEARNSFSVNAYTGVVLLCRKLLMHISIELGADPGKRFIEYVNYLDENHYISAKSKIWVDKIRTSGNEANHEMNMKNKKEAANLIKFCEMIMKTNFEYPSILEETFKNI